MKAEDDVAVADRNVSMWMKDDGSTVVSFHRSEEVVIFNHVNEVVAAANTSYMQPAAKNYQ